MSVTIQPPLSSWKPAAPAAIHQQLREPLADLVSRRAARLNTSTLTAASPLLATGHQAWLWHPGILAKFLALAAASKQHGAASLHLVADQDAHPALALPLPIHTGNLLSIDALKLAPQTDLVPTGCHPPADPTTILQSLQQAATRHRTDLQADLAPIQQAFTNLPQCFTLAEQLAVVLTRLMQPYAGPIPLLFTTDLATFPAFSDVIAHMLADPGRCAATYNQAISQAANSQWGLSPLRIEPKRVELPLWLLRRLKPRLRVFADMSNPATPQLITEIGQPIPLSTPDPSNPLATNQDRLAPKALLLSAFMRSICSDLFIHGQGGANYDSVTELWWSNWGQPPLAPKTVVSADLFLHFNAPIATPADLAHALWHHHHLPHNLDRTLSPSSPQSTSKKEILAQLAASTDRSFKARLFAELHQINQSLAAAHPDLLTASQNQLDRAHAGVLNQAVASKRDWPFPLYPAQQLHELAQSFRDQPGM